jgi:hemerythrin
MNLVSNTKTLIFDDIYEEIKNLRSALDSLKVQNLYIKFDEPDEIEEENKFTNVRFVFADIIMGGGRIGEKADIAPIVTSINEHISKKNGAFVLIVWSKTKDDLSRAFIAELESEGHNFFPITNIKKEKYTKETKNDKEKKELLNELIEELKKELTDEVEYFNLLRIWEKDIHTAASETFNILLDDLNDKNKTHSLLKNAVIASAGTKQTTDETSKRKNLWNTLNLILNDTVESLLHTQEIKPEIVETLKKLDEDNPTVTNELVNKKLLFSTTNTTDMHMYPGNIFCFDSYYVSICDDIKDNICGYKNKKALVNELLDSKEFNQYITEIKESKEFSKKETSAFRNSEIESFLPILLEFTPFCDFSQKGYKKARLIYGHIIPVHLRKYIMSGTKYIYMTPNFELIKDVENVSAGKYFIALNIKHIFGVNPDFLNNFTLLFRARKELVNDIQHDIANHISRVGVTSL